MSGHSGIVMAYLEAMRAGERVPVIPCSVTDLKLNTMLNDGWLSGLPVAVLYFEGDFCE